jgi:hypothetical protein
MSDWNESPVATQPVEEETFDFEVTDVTGTNSFTARNVQRALPAGAVATSLVDRMLLPRSSPWVLRDDSTSAYLDDSRPIGEQIGPNAKVTITPKTHLGQVSG